MVMDNAQGQIEKGSEFDIKWSDNRKRSSFLPAPKEESEGKRKGSMFPGRESAMHGTNILLTLSGQSFVLST